jgi:hypothetical protein
MAPLAPLADKLGIQIYVKGLRINNFAFCGPNIA